ncbi:helix-turn-helix transcriptional regulator [Nostoc sp. NIES-2111]
MNPFWDHPNSGFNLRGGVRNKAYIRFCELLIEARQNAGLTQRDLAQKLDRPQSFVSKYERRERRLDVVEFFEIARAIGFDPIRFLKTFDKENP